jgi:hypothetical protein
VRSSDDKIILRNDDANPPAYAIPGLTRRPTANPTTSPVNSRWLWPATGQARRLRKITVRPASRAFAKM